MPSPDSCVSCSGVVMGKRAQELGAAVKISFPFVILSFVSQWCSAAYWALLRWLRRRLILRRELELDISKLRLRCGGQN